MSVKLLSCPGGRTTKSTRTCGGIGPKKIIYIYILLITEHNGGVSPKSCLQ